jgi:hypothetical protein
LLENAATRIRKLVDSKWDAVGCEGSGFLIISCLNCMQFG